MNIKKREGAPAVLALFFVLLENFDFLLRAVRLAVGNYG